jgi:hypothetical protein
LATRSRTNSRSGGRGPSASRRTPSNAIHPTSPALEPPSAPSLTSATLPRVWQGIGYRPLPDGAPARPLFDFAAVPWPGTDVAFAWGAFAAVATGGERLVGALVAERSGAAVLLHGPVVTSDVGATALEVAAQIVAAALDHAAALGVITIYARPQGLDRVWIRFGFIPVPEVALPATLAGRPGVGLYAWRGGTALWTFREAAND